MSVRVAHGNADVGKVTSSAIQLQNIDEAICTTSVPTARRRQVPRMNERMHECCDHACHPHESETIRRRCDSLAWHNNDGNEARQRRSPTHDQDGWISHYKLNCNEIPNYQSVPLLKGPFRYYSSHVLALARVGHPLPY
ncbi:hypothetical protein SCLCIDRAFT_1211785 [Scleroderma citrinum Foug A]|uniref:Uncharacterized protein n=1 Tax=Scleroderma citrinum Foug A TaxID=1036808 RepID=A0A0C2ZWF3_9AGAM|nr:hypothetical protein SCLCIDRAFT_1211785 [Scleroderma citrinum Foug A]